MTAPVCPYCSRESELVRGDRIYPNRPDLATKSFYLCAPCNAYVGCHPNSTRPLGRLAGADLRQWKRAVHMNLDSLWKHGKMTRSESYAWLAKAMGIPQTKCHIGMFDAATCQKAIDAIRQEQSRNQTSDG